MPSSQDTRKATNDEREKIHKQYVSSDGSYTIGKRFIHIACAHHLAKWKAKYTNWFVYFGKSERENTSERATIVECECIAFSWMRIQRQNNKSHTLFSFLSFFFFCSFGRISFQFYFSFEILDCTFFSQSSFRGRRQHSEQKQQANKVKLKNKRKLNAKCIPESKIRRISEKKQNIKIVEALNSDR